MKLHPHVVSVLVAILLLALYPGVSQATSIINSNSTMYLLWQSESNVVYLIENSLGLEDGTWTNSIPEIVGSGEAMQQAVTNSVGLPLPGSAFFRVVTFDATNVSNQDMLTPPFYNSATNASFRTEVNRFVYYARKEVFHHPLEDVSGNMPIFSVPATGEFGATKPLWGTPSSYHPAVDLHVGNGETNVNLYAAHDGVVSVYRDADKYRHYLSITKDINDADGNVLGKLSTLYAHIDLDLDEAGGLFMDGQTVAKGDLVSRNLWSGTVGGPHLHFEIRYYRAGEIGKEEFYGGALYSEPSAGPWIYGYWDPLVGYGFAHPSNHRLTLY